MATTLQQKRPHSLDSGQPGRTYYQSRSWSPWLYVQEEGAWHAYAADGTWLRSRNGRIPNKIRGQLEEISEPEANKLLRAGRGEAVAAGSMRLGPPSDYSIAAVGLEFRPRAWRLLLREMGIVALIGVSILLVVDALVGLPAWPWYVWVVLAVARPVARGLGASLAGGPKWDGPERENIVVSETGISKLGPDGVKDYIALAELDYLRSATRTLRDRLLLRQYFYSMAGERIRLRRWAFRRTDIRRLLALVGLED